MSKPISDPSITDLTIVQMDGTQQIPAADPNQVGAEVRATQGVLSLASEGEYTASGVLVYPYFFPENESRTFDNNQLIQRTTNNGSGTTWTMDLVRGTWGVTSMQSTDGTTIWNRTFTYNAAGSVATDSGWS